MGHKHIDSLKEASLPTTTQERVGEDTLSESKRNVVDVRKTDVNIQQPEKLSYADIVKKRTQRKRPESDTESAEATRITFRK